MKIFITVLLSISIHFMLYIIFMDKDIIQNNISTKKDKLTHKKTSIKYVKLKQKEIKKPIKPKKINNSKMLEKKVNKQKIKNKEIQKPKAIIKKNLKKIPKPILKKYKQKKIQKKPMPIDKVTQSYIDLYGEKFKNYSEETKVYLIKNIKDIGAITKIFLEYPYMSIQANQSGISVVEFKLYPNGTISNLKIIKSSNYFLLDDNTMETIQEAYSDYPRPTKPTIIRIYVKYQLY